MTTKTNTDLNVSGKDSAPESRKPLEDLLVELRERLRREEPVALAKRTGADYEPANEESGKFVLDYWGRPITLSYPAFIAIDSSLDTPLMTLDQALLLYYFLDSDGFPASGTWIAFSELPNATFYTQAFQGYSGQQLVRSFGDDVETLSSAASASGGRRFDFADLAFYFQVMPKVPLLLACWLGDEDFPNSYRILFDASVSHHLSTDGCAILGSLLTGRLIKSGNRRTN